MLIFVVLVIPAALCASLSEDGPVFISRIVNGEDAQPNEFPWQISLQFLGSSGNWGHVCGAVVLDSGRILTAAHCVHHECSCNNPNPTKFRVIAGEHDRVVDSGHEQTVNVREIRVHASYTGTGGYNNDLAVLLLDGSLTLNDKVGPVELPLAAQNFEGLDCYISGWGRAVANDANAPLPNILQKAATSILAHSSCRSQLGITGLLYLTQTAHICIYTGYNSACNGDSGGPLVCDVSGISGLRTWRLAGVTSWGLSGCPPSSPSVYVRITSYLDWINSQV